MTADRKLDWKGEEVPPDEPWNKTILVWEVDPHPFKAAGSGEVLLERSIEKMVDLVEGAIESFIWEHSEEQLRQGVTLQFRLVAMPVSEYEKD